MLLFKLNSDDSIDGQKNIVLAKNQERHRKRREKHQTRKASWESKKDVCENEAREVASQYGKVNDTGEYQLPSRSWATSKIVVGFLFSLGLALACAGEFSLTYVSINIFPLPEIIKELFAWAITVMIAIIGEWYIWSHLDTNSLRRRSYYLYRISQRYSKIFLFLCLVVQAALGSMRGVIFATNISMKFGWQHRFPFLAAVSKIAVPLLMVLAAILVTGALLFSFHYAKEYLTKGLRVWFIHRKLARIPRKVALYGQKLVGDDAWKTKVDRIETEKSRIRSDRLHRRERKHNATEQKRKENEAAEDARKKAKYEDWHTDPEKSKNNGSASKVIKTIIAFVIPVVSLSSSGCVKTGEEQKLNPNRVPLELSVVPDFSGSQSDEKDANKAVVVSIAENLGPGDHLRVVPIDIASEGRNETLVDVTIPVAGGAMDFDLLSARNEARDKAEDIYQLYAHRQELIGGTSIVGALNTAGVLDSTFNRCRRFLIIISDLEENSWEASVYSTFDARKLVDSLQSEGRIPDLHDREVWVAGSTDAHVGPRRQQEIKKFWTLFAQKTRCKSFRWYGYDRALLKSDLAKIQKEGQPEETF